jgi:cation/acetate symporter
VLVGRTAIGAVGSGGNMAAPLLAEVLGGTAFLGFISAVAFATILAVVAGLTLSGAGALAHDLWNHVVRHGKITEREQLLVARIATVVLALAAIGLGELFHGQNVAFMVGLAFSIAASANFPALLLSMTWKRLTTRGAVASMATGAASSVILIVLSPTVWVELLHNATPVIDLKNPGVISVPLAFLVAIVVSLAQREPESERGFVEAQHRMHVGTHVAP